MYEIIIILFVLFFFSIAIIWVIDNWKKEIELKLEIEISK